MEPTFEEITAFSLYEQHIYPNHDRRVYWLETKFATQAELARIAVLYRKFENGEG